MIYVLSLEHGKYYVGATERQHNERLLEHFANVGAEWTKLHRPIQVLDIFNYSQEKEDAITLETMAKYGWWNVRGGQWCKVVMTEPPVELDLSAAMALPREQSVWCRRCLRTTHTTDMCYAKTDARGQPLHCSRCGRTSHVASNCYARTTVSGKELPPQMTESLLVETPITESKIDTATGTGVTTIQTTDPTPDPTPDSTPDSTTDEWIEIPSV
jgi:predicted GIY-YIG superfamily endonuclease